MMKSVQFLTVLWGVIGLNAMALAAKEIARDSLSDQGKKAFESGKYTRALEIFSQVVGSAPDSQSRSLGYYYQGLTFFEMGYFYSSFLCFKNVLSAPDEGNRELFEKGIKNAVLIADKLGIMEQLGALLDKLPNSLVAPSVAALNHYAIGYYQFHKNNQDEALSRLKSVSPESQFYPKALFLLGVLTTRKKDYKEAAGYFSKVVELTRGKRELFAQEELARLNLARTVYSAGDMERAVEIYAKFSSASSHWLTVLLEASWPLMRINDTTVSLGNLHTITSPFYRENLVGEAFILRTTILYNLCKYEEMSQTLALFFTIYDPVIRAMQTEASHVSGGEAFFRAFAGKKLNPSFMNYVARDSGVERDLKVLDLLKAERRGLAKLTRPKQLSTQAESLKEKIDDAERMFSQDLGGILESLHKRKLSELLEQREQANYLKVEIVTGEKELIEGQKGLPPKRVVDVETTVADGYEFWPFHGEYWEDEMGAYVYTTESACIR